ncbi:hypothetical protein J4468_02755 [Candidatus Woesearchaeota archaeon]|nr:hypothetical protein [Candidatus Woesearchaeota archaeon]
MDICKTCKNKLYCGKKGCLIYSKLLGLKTNKLIEGNKDFFGDVPNIFVGRYGYPDIRVGMLSTEEYMGNDNTKLWIEKKFDIDKIISLRSLMINSTFNVSVKTKNNRFLETSQEIALSKKPVDVEINLDKVPKFGIVNPQREAIPFGPSVKLMKASICENPKIPMKVEKVVSDSDLKAVDAMSYLSKNGYDEHYLTKILSSGSVGVKTQRKLVPTRWAITAVDDTLGKGKIRKIKDFRSSAFKIHFGGYMGNYYIALFFPGVWSYELFETYVHSSEYCTDYENYDGRKEYASATAGGYYAARIGLLEKMELSKEQASVLLLRFITDEYYAPLGVWVVRTAVRKCMESDVLEFDCREKMIEHALNFIKQRFTYDAQEMIKNSLLIKEIKEQRKLFEF